MRDCGFMRGVVVGLLFLKVDFSWRDVTAFVWGCCQEFAGGNYFTVLDF